MMTNAERPPLGIIMLDTAFERPPGDVGNPATWPFPVRFKTVRGATARKIVSGNDAELLEAFVAAGDALKAEGAIGLITSCGFLAARQHELAARMSLPLATSSLLQIPLVERTLPARGRVGVVTYDAEQITSHHFEAAGAAADTPCVGLPMDGHFHGLIERGEPYSHTALEQEVTTVVAKLLDTHRDIAAIVFECTNLPPFSDVVRRTFRRPVYDIVTLGTWFYAGLVKAGEHIA